MPQVLENALGQTMVLPRTLFIRGFNRPITTGIVEGETGNVIARPSVRRPVTGALTGTLTGSSYADARSKLDDLLSFLSAGPIKIRLHGPTDRYLLCLVENIADTHPVARAAQVNVALTAPDPLWHGAETSHAQEVTSSPLNLSITVGGNAVTHPVIRLLGRSSGGNPSRQPSITNAATGRTLTWVGDLSSGQVLTLDSEARLAHRGSAGVLDNMNSDYLLHGFPLAPGVNNLTVTLATPSAPVRFELDWIERWL